MWPPCCTDLILEVLDLILKGGMPRAEDLLLLREFLLSGVHLHDMYTPLDPWQHLHTMTMEVRGGHRQAEGTDN